MSKSTVQRKCLYEPHSLIESVHRCASLEDIVPLALTLHGDDTEVSQASDAESIERIWSTFEEELALDITPTLATWITRRLRMWVQREHECKTCADLLRALTMAYAAMADTWAPLYVAYVNTALRVSADYNISDAYFIARDAIPFYLIACELRNMHMWDGRAQLLECHRAMFGIPTEFGSGSDKWVSNHHRPFGPPAQEALSSPTRAYLERFCHPPVPVAWIESGYYGTLLKKLADLGLLPSGLFFFFASANPNIFGFMNTLVISGNLRLRQVDYNMIYLAGDQVEAIPKPYRESTIELVGGTPQPIAHPVAVPYLAASLAFYWQLIKSVSRVDPPDIDPWREIGQLYRIWQQVINGSEICPLILPRCIPGWADGLAFLRYEFDLGPLPPMNEWCGP